MTAGGLQAARRRSREAGARVEAGQLRRQAKAIFSPATFAASAKLERKANAIDKALQRSAGGSPRLKAAGRACKAVQVRQTVKHALQFAACA